MSQYSSTQLGYFLTYEFWQDGLKLLNYQIERKRFPNKHFYTLSMFYYEQVESQVTRINSEKYFKQRVANNLFYALSNEFGIYPYVQPKSGLALRNYVFLTYPLRVVYYSVGLYLLKLSNDFITYMRAIPEIKSYYGGNLEYNGNQLLLNPDRVYYRNHYNKFRSSIMEVIDNQDKDTVCLRLDISNYFDNIKIPLLLDLLNDYIKPAIKHDLKFDSSTIDHLSFFFDYLRVEFTGIPQMDNGIISDFIGYLYLIFGDLFIHELLQSLVHEGRIIRYQIFRYVDDVYLFLQLKQNISETDRDGIVTNIGTRIADLLNKKLSLRYNKKTGYYRLARENERQELRLSLKRVSPDEALPDDNDPRSPKERADEVLKELRLLKASELTMSFDYASGDKAVAVETLKDVFSESIDNILNAHDYKKELLTIFDDFNFNLMYVHPSSLMSIICRPSLLGIAQKFENYLIQQQDLTYKEIDLNLRFLAHEEFKNRKLLAKLKQESYMKTIIDIFEKAKIVPRYPGYFDLANKQVNKILKFDNVIHQVRLRYAAEKRSNYSEALNHLLNEIHGICFELHRLRDLTMSKDIKNYKVDDVIAFLQSENVPGTVVPRIRNLFDRRNINTMSHPGSSNAPALDVTKADYHHYYQYVGECLSHILR